MIIIKLILLLLFLIFFLTAAGTIVTYIIKWYDIVNNQSEPDSGKWRQNINYGAIGKGIVIEIFTAFLYVISMPLRLYYDGIPRHIVPEDQYPVLLVHGWGSSSHCFALLHSFLRRRGFNNIFAITYRPVTADIGHLSQQVADKINLITEETGSPKVDVITHSMGGVLVRYAIKYLHAGDRVDKLITLAGPHMGSRTTVLFPMGDNPLQLSYKSEFLTELAEGGLTLGEIEYTSIYSDFDNMVIPQESSDLGPGARNIKISYHGHSRLLYSPEVMKLIERELRRKDQTNK